MTDQREQFRDALDPNDPAGAACISALDGGATLQVWDDIASRDNLVTIYARRVEHLRENGAPTTGSDDLLKRLAAAGTSLRLAEVNNDRWHFVIFRDSTTGDVAAVWGVDANLGNPAFEA